MVWPVCGPPPGVSRIIRATIPRRPSRRWLSRRRSRRPSHPPCSPPPPLSCVPHGDAVNGAGSSSTSSESASDVASLLPLSLLHPSLSQPPPPVSSPHLPRVPVAARPRPLAPAPSPGCRYCPKGRRCRQSDRRSCYASVVGGRICAPWKMA